jgi:hypothetical protein
MISPTPGAQDPIGCDDDVDLAPANPLPLIVALAVGEAAVLNGDACAEGLPEERGDHRRQRNFGHQHQHAAAAATDLRREPQIELGLSAAGDAVQQRDAERPRVRERAQALARGRLFDGEAAIGIHRRGGIRPGGEGIAVHAVLTKADQGVLRQP